MNPSPRPWKITRAGSAYMEGTIITDPTGRWEIAGVWEEEDAEHIVKCVNMHDGLVRALGSLERTAGIASMPDDPARVTARTLLEKARRHNES